MTEPSPLFKIPEFPTLYGEEERKRQAKLAEQKSQIEELFRTKFDVEAWANLPGPERAIREFIAKSEGPVSFSGFAGLVSPWEWGFDYGVIPSQARERQQEVEAEYDELIRKEKVTTVLPLIQNTLRILAMAGESVPGDFDSFFKLDKLDFTPEEKAYLYRFEMSLKFAKPEELLSGEPWGLRKASLEEIEAATREEPGAKLTPNQALSTIALSQDTEAIRMGLMMAYPPVMVEPPDDRRDAIIKLYNEQITALAEYLGVSTTLEEPIKETAGKVFEKLAEDRPVLIYDYNLGGIHVANRKPDNSVWSRGRQADQKLLGYYDEDQKHVVPIAPDGEPITNNDTLLDKAKDLASKFFQLGFGKPYKTSIPGIMFGIAKSLDEPEDLEFLAHNLHRLAGESGLSTELFIKTYVPSGISSAVADMLIEGGAPPEYIKAKREAGVPSVPWATGVKKMNEDLQSIFTQSYEQRTVEHFEWLEEHPEFIPKPSWQVPVTEVIRDNPELLKNPYYIAYLTSDSLIYTGAFLSTALAIGWITKNPTLGLAAGVAVTTPQATHDLYQELLNYIPPEDAARLAISMGAVISSVEVVGGVPVISAILPSVFRGLRRGIQKEVVALTFKRLALKGIKTFGTIEVMETMEEILQEALHNATIRWFDETRDIFANMPEVAIRAMISIGPIAAVGGGASVYHESKLQLPEKVKEQLDTDTQTLVEAGLPPDQAELAAYNKVVSTDQGIAEVQVAQEKALDQRPFTQARQNNNREVLEQKLEAVNNDLEAISRSLVIHRKRSVGMELLSVEHAEILKTMGFLEDQVPELQATKARIVEQLRALNTEPELPTPPEATRTFPIDKVITWKRQQVSEATSPLDKSFLNQELRDLLQSKQQGKPTVPEEYFRDVRTKELVVPPELQPVPLELLPEVVPPSRASYIRTGMREFRAQASETLTRTEERVQRKVLNERYDSEYDVPPGILIGQVPEGVVEAPPVEVPPAEGAPPIVPPIKPPAPPGETFPIPEESDPEVREILSRMALAKAARRVGKYLEELGVTPDILEGTLDTLPSPISLEDELASANEVFSDPKFQSYLRVDPNVQAARRLAEQELFRVQLESANAEESKDPDQMSIAKQAVKSYTNRVGLRPQDVLTTFWKDLTPAQQRRATTAHIPNGSIILDREDPIIGKVLSRATLNLEDMRYLFANLEGWSGEPFHRIHERIVTLKSYALRLQDMYLEEITKNPTFKHILPDEASWDRVTTERESRNPDSGVSPPSDLTDVERSLADTIDSRYRKWEPYERYLRFVRAYKISDNPTTIQEELTNPHYPEQAPPIEELEKAVRIYEQYGKDTLWLYLKDKTWGVVPQGYSPRVRHKMSLFPTQLPLGATRGTGRLMSRTALESPPAQEKNPVSQLDSYNASMLTMLLLEEEIDALARSIQNTEQIWSAPDQVETIMRNFLTELQGVPQEGGWLFDIIQTAQRYAFTIFVQPDKGIRNILQPLMAFPFRHRLVTGYYEFPNLPAPFRKKASIVFADLVDESGRALREWMFFTGRKGLTANPFELMARVCERLPLMAWTDKGSRMWEFLALVPKTWGASEQYVKDGNVDKWVRDSGANTLTRKQQEYAVWLLAQQEVNWVIPGLQDLTGPEAAGFWVTRQVITNTLYTYRRWGMAPAHHGVTGRAVGSLLNFPRSTAQYIVRLFEKTADPESSMRDRTEAVRKIAFLWLFSEISNVILKCLLGGKRDEYGLTNMLLWEIGGLSLSAAREATEAITETILALIGSGEEKERAWTRLSTVLPSTFNLMLGFYSIAWDVVELMQKEGGGLDAFYIRRIRALIDDSYGGPKEREKVERTWLEAFQKVVAGTDPPEPDILEQILIDLDTEIERLGGMILVGDEFTTDDVYTTKQLGGRIDAILKRGSPTWVHKDNRFPNIAIFRQECTDGWKPYEILSSKPASIRREWRLNHFEEEAKMIFWGKYSFKASPFVTDPGLRKEGKAMELLKLIDLYKIEFNLTRSMVPGATWKDILAEEAKGLTE